MIKDIFKKSDLKTEAEEDPTKYFAVIDGDQGRMHIIIKDTHEELKDFLYKYCKSPTDIEATGTCDKNGIICNENGEPAMTNPTKFSRKWLDTQIRNQQRTLKEMLFGK
jgi:hypothetical protein